MAILLKRLSPQENRSARNPQLNRGGPLVKLRYVAGRSIDEAAEALGMSPRTADRRWAYARAWLRQEMLGE